MDAIRSLLFVVLAAQAWGCAGGGRVPGTGASREAESAGADSLVAAAQRAAGTGDYGTAKSFYDAALNAEPNYPPALRGLAALSEDISDPASTIYYCEKLIETAGSGPEDHARLAQALVRAGRPAEALRRLESATERYPKDGRLHSETGLLLVDLGRDSEAVAYLEQSVQLGGPSSRPAHRALGRILFDDGRYQEAAATLSSYDALYPGDFDVNMELAYIHYSSGDYEAALPRYRAAADAKPNSVDARVGVAKSLEGIGRIDGAIRVYDEALEIRGLTREMEPVIIAQANLLNQRGKYDRALALVERAGEVFPETAGLACARGMALVGEGRYDEAIAAFTRATGDPKWSEFANEQIRRLRNTRRGRGR